jgi:hypothetical protein
MPGSRCIAEMWDLAALVDFGGRQVKRDRRSGFKPSIFALRGVGVGEPSKNRVSRVTIASCE